MERDARSDDKAMQEYETRLEQLTQEIKEADKAMDTETAEKLRGDFDRLAEFFTAEKKARLRGHTPRCGKLSPPGKADQNLRMGFKRLTERLCKAGMPKLADHLTECIVPRCGEWRYVQSPGTPSWEVSSSN
jgi:hypothetical protein